ncbi:MAG: deoxyribonuclease IV [Phycisphaeraceae bacterium]|nr:deoxyribonuclease IV [Phycisphaeraceae bacterium]
MFGSHLSISGSMHQALLEAERYGMDTVQVFTKNQQQWKTKPLEADAIKNWLTELKRLGWRDRVVSHAGYLSNLASPDNELWEKSVDLMTIEIERCETLEIPILVHHPGAYTTSSAAQGIDRIARAYQELFNRTKGFRTIVCLEGTVGAGSQLGGTFEELSQIRAAAIERSAPPERIGYCLDTCHLHAAGYDMSTRASADAAIEQFDRICGLANLRAMHLNDSKGKVGSKLDRHEHLGRGTIGGEPTPVGLSASGFASFVNHSKLARVPMILETPKGEDEKGRSWDAINLALLRCLRSGQTVLGPMKAGPSRTRPRNKKTLIQTKSVKSRSISRSISRSRNPLKKADPRKP